MSNVEQAQYLVSLPLSQYKALKKAIRVLRNAGFDYETALRLTVQAHFDNRRAR